MFIRFLFHPARTCACLCAGILALLVLSPAALADGGDRPDIIFLLLDDMNADMLEHLDRIESEIADEGTTFENFFISTPVCCPSRSNFLLGEFSHDHGVWEVKNSPVGGWHTFRRLGHEENVFAKPMKEDFGYHTALMGKFFNWYPNDGDPDNPMTGYGWKNNDVPPYWYSWRGMRSGTMFSYYGTDFNECDNCVAGPTGATVVDTPATGIDKVYSTDYLRDEAVEFIEASYNDGKSIFLWIAPVAPHKQSSNTTPVPPDRYATSFPSETWPDKPNLFEDDRTDKASWLTSLPELNETTTRPLMDEYFRDALRSLEAVEDLLFGDGTHDGVLDALEDDGRLDNTYIFIASDNGYHYGEHHLPDGKRTFFEEDVRVPLLVRGPGVPAGRTLPHLVGNVDLARTFIEIAGGNAPLAMDGRSLLPLLREAAPPTDRWRQVTLLERQESPGTPGPEDSYAVRTADYKYIRYPDDPGPQEQLYDLDSDPYELESLHADSGQATRKAALEDALDELKPCDGAGCRSWDGRDPEDSSRKVAGAIFNPCITTSGNCSTTIAWDSRFFTNGYLWILNDFGTAWRCMASGGYDHDTVGPWTWGGTVKLHVYDSTIPCGGGNSPLSSELVQTLSIPKAVEPTGLPTAQILTLPSPCVNNGSGQCVASIFVKSANIDTGVYDRLEVRTPNGTLWQQITPNTTFKGLTGAWTTGTTGREMSLYPGKDGTSVCSSPCDVTDPASNLGPRFDYAHIYRD